MLHQFGHELRRHAPLLLAWCVLVGLHLFLSGSRFAEEQSAPGANGKGLIAIFVTAAVFLPFLLVPLIVQADAPLDENAFWATRPLRGTSLFGGKLLLVALFFVLLPLGVEMAILAQSPALPADALVTQIGRNFLPLIILFVLPACVVMAVLEDPVAGTNAFWMTRPARARTLLAAKALLVGALLLAYLASQAIVLWMHGGFRLTPYLLGGFAVGALPFIAVVFAAAAMAGDPTRLFVTAAIGLAASGVLMVVGHFMFTLFLPGVTLGPGRDATLVASARLGIGTLVLLAALGLAGHQYATRRTARTGVLAGLAVLLLAGLFATWRIDFFRKPPVNAEREAALGLDRFQPLLRGDKAGLVRSITEDALGGESVRILLNVPVSTAELPDGWVVRSLTGTVNVRTGRGEAITRTLTVNALGPDQGPPRPKGFQRADRAHAHEPEAGFILALVDLPEAEYRALGETTLAGTLELNLQLARREIAAELPFAEGASVRQGAETWMLRSLRPGFSTLGTTGVNGVIEHREVLTGVAMDLDVTGPDLWLHTAAGGRRPPRFLDEIRVLLVNRERGEWMRRGGGGTSFVGSQPGVPVVRSPLSLHFDAATDLDPDWFDGATLGIVADTDEATLHRTVRVDDVRVLQD